jgi:hypothetical protein
LRSTTTDSPSGLFLSDIFATILLYFLTVPSVQHVQPSLLRMTDLKFAMVKIFGAFQRPQLAVTHAAFLWKELGGVYLQETTAHSSGMGENRGKTPSIFLAFMKY